MAARAAYASADFSVLSLFFKDDELLLPDGSRMLHEAYTGRPAAPDGAPRIDQRIDQRTIEPTDYGHQRIGHFGFFKPQCEATLWPVVTQWLDTKLDMRKAA